MLQIDVATGENFEFDDLCTQPGVGAIHAPGLLGAVEGMKSCFLGVS